MTKKHALTKKLCSGASEIITLADVFPILSDVLVFPSLGIVNARYSMQINSKGVFAQHAMRQPEGLTIAVETNKPVDATVVVTVTQGHFSVGNSW